MSLKEVDKNELNSGMAGRDGDRGFVVEDVKRSGVLVQYEDGEECIYDSGDFSVADGDRQEDAYLTIR